MAKRRRSKAVKVFPKKYQANTNYIRGKTIYRSAKQFFKAADAHIFTQDRTRSMGTVGRADFTGPLQSEKSIKEEPLPKFTLSKFKGMPVAEVLNRLECMEVSWQDHEVAKKLPKSLVDKLDIPSVMPRAIEAYNPHRFSGVDRYHYVVLQKTEERILRLYFCNSKFYFVEFVNVSDAGVKLRVSNRYPNREWAMIAFESERILWNAEETLEIGEEENG